MGMSQNGKGFLWWVALAGICWLFYASVFDTDGNFDPSIDTDVIEFRIGWRLGNAAQRTDRAIIEQNREMQGAVNTRERRVNRKVDDQTGAGE